MFCGQKRHIYRWEVCLYMTSLFIVAWCYNPCPEFVRNSASNKPPAIPEERVEMAFQIAEANSRRYRLLENQMNNTDKLLPKDVKTAETTHPQASQKPEIPRMEARQRIFEEATKWLAGQYKLTAKQMSCSLPHLQPTGPNYERALELCLSDEVIVCNSTQKYRTPDGSCNNLDNPTWGRALSPFSRLFVPSYQGNGNFRRSVNCGELPPPRTLSLNVHHNVVRRTGETNDLWVFFGQFLSHDLTFTAQSITEYNEGINCCPRRLDNHPQCAPIDIPPYDPFYRRFGITCLNFIRSAVFPTCTLGFREQINTASSFIDGSQIYGNSLAEMNNLRALDGTGILITMSKKGVKHTFRKWIQRWNQCIEVEDEYFKSKLLVQDNRFGPILPPSNDPDHDRCSIPKNNETCFRAGDRRVNQNPLLTSLHTLWVREHNRIATHLKRINPRWDEDTLFEESRRILIAELQSITYKEYLPLLIGNERLHTYDLGINWDTDHKRNVDPFIINEFATAAFRFGHSMIDSMLSEIPRRQGHSGHLLRDKYFDPFGLYEGELDPLMMGASKAAPQTLDRFLVPDVTNFLYRIRGQPTGSDLASLNIQRGRDHDLPSYVECCNFCNPQNPVDSFDDLVEKHYMHAETMEVLRMYYAHVNDIDLWTGIVSEIHVTNGILGPTGVCIVGRQFSRLKSGDRFWFTHRNQPGSFTNAQQQTLRWHSTLTKLICDNTDISEMQREAMKFPSSSNPVQQCRSFPGVNLDLWRQS